MPSRFCSAHNRAAFEYETIPIPRACARGYQPPAALRPGTTPTASLHVWRGAVAAPPEGFGKWVEANADRIARAKSLPYFIKDNKKYAGIAKAIPLKGTAKKGSSKSETRRVLRDVITEDYIGKTRDYSQDEAFRKFCKDLGVEPTKVKPMTFLEADSGISNNHRGNPDFENNCLSCVFAN